MENLLQKKFTIKQFADIYGINKKTLMYYDDIGLFKPAYIGKNGYRYYFFEQTLIFEVILVLCKLRVPLKEIKYYLNNYTKENLRELFYAQEQKIDKQIAELVKLKRLVRNKINNIEMNSQIDFSKIEVLEVQQQAMLVSDALDLKEESFLGIVSNFMKNGYNNKMYSGHPIGVILDVKRLQQGEHKPITNCFCLIDNTDRSIAGIVYKPAGKYLVAYYRGDWHNIQKTYEKMFEYAEANKLQLDDFLYEERLFEDTSDQVLNYFEIKISVLLK